MPTSLIMTMEEDVAAYFTPFIGPKPDQLEMVTKTLQDDIPCERPILIIGPEGSGKSLLARGIASALFAGVYKVNAEQWLSGAHNSKGKFVPEFLFQQIQETFQDLSKPEFGGPLGKMVLIVENVLKLFAHKKVFADLLKERLRGHIMLNRALNKRIVLIGESKENPLADVRWFFGDVLRIPELALKDKMLIFQTNVERVGGVLDASFTLDEECMQQFKSLPAMAIESIAHRSVVWSRHRAKKCGEEPHISLDLIKAAIGKQHSQESYERPSYIL